MRTRRQIEDGFKDMLIPGGSDHIKLQIELLLDMRSLLVEMLNDSRIDKIRDSRILQQEVRKQDISE